MIVSRGMAAEDNSVTLGATPYAAPYEASSAVPAVRSGAEQPTSSTASQMTPYLPAEALALEPHALRRPGPIAALTTLAGLAVVFAGVMLARSGQDHTWLPTQLTKIIPEGTVLHSGTVVGGLLLALLGAAVVGLTYWRTLPDTLAGPPLLLRLQGNWLAVVPFAAGAAALGTLYTHLLNHQYSHIDIALFAGGMVLLGLGIAALDQPLHVRHIGVNRWDALAMLAVGLVTAALYSPDLTSWHFSNMGDEGAFFQAALGIARGGEWNVFDLTYVYGTHPTLDSVIHAGGIKVAGESVIGWRVAELILMSASAVLLYPLGVLLFGRLAAVVACAVFSSNHYLMAFSRIGYNNTHAVFFVVLALLMLALAWRTGRAVFVYATGVALGLCLYTFMAALLIWPLVACALFIVFFRRPSWVQVRAGVLMTLAFALTLAPGFMVTPLTEFSHVATANTYYHLVQDQNMARLVSLTDSTVVFWSNEQWRHHYVAGPLLDPLSAMLVLCGLGVALLRINKRAERLVLLWALGAILLVSVTDLGMQAQLTRLHIVVPAFGLLAGLAATGAYNMLRRGLRLPVAAAMVPLALLIAAVPPVNLHTLLVFGPSIMEGDIVMVRVKLMQEHRDRMLIEVGELPEPDQNWMLRLTEYPWLAKSYRYTPMQEFLSDTPKASEGVFPLYIVDASNDVLANVVSQRLGTGYRSRLETDATGRPVVILFLPTEALSPKQGPIMTSSPFADIVATIIRPTT